jgi:hypothetical protein
MFLKRKQPKKKKKIEKATITIAVFKGVISNHEWKVSNRQSNLFENDILRNLRD